MKGTPGMKYFDMAARMNIMAWILQIYYRVFVPGRIWQPLLSQEDQNEKANTVDTVLLTSVRVQR